MINCVSGKCASVKGVEEAEMGPKSFVGCACTLVGWACNFMSSKRFYLFFYDLFSRNERNVLVRCKILLPVQILIALVLFEVEHP